MERIRFKLEEPIKHKIVQISSSLGDALKVSAIGGYTVIIFKTYKNLPRISSS
jgi:hypothetical protein